MADTTLERAKYELVKRNQASLAQVETLLLKEANNVLTRSQAMDQNQLGGYLRTVVPGLVDKYGKVNATLAMKYYDEQRLLAMKNLSNRDYRRSSERVAAAKLKSQIYVATMEQKDAAKVAEPIVGYGMSRFMDAGHQAMSDAVQNSLTRAVASYNRDTILYNSALDDAVVGVQRVAEPNACSFCSTIALNSGTWKASESRVATYAVDFHDNCKCSIETLYLGDKPVRPDYYDTYEAEYIAATKEVGSSNGKQVFAQIRSNRNK